jgi:hypothetical protein
MQLGCALEWAIKQRFIQHEHNLTEGWELCKDNVFGTFDALEVNKKIVPDNEIIVEIKLTSKRAPPLPPGWRPGDPDDTLLHDGRFAAWLAQLKSYMHMYGTNHGRVIAVFVSRDLTCAWRDWRVTFTDLELKLHWASMLSIAQMIRQENAQ